MSISAKDVLDAFAFDRERNIEASAGDAVKLFDTLLIAELPDFDPVSIRDEIGAVWTIKGMDASSIGKPRSWDAVLTIPSRTRPGSYDLTLALRYKDTSRTLRQVVVVSPKT